MVIKDMPVNPEVRLDATLPFYHPEIGVITGDLVSYLKKEAERWALQKMPYLSAPTLCIRLVMGDAGYCLGGIEMCILGEIDVRQLAVFNRELADLGDLSAEAFILNTHDDWVRPRLVFIAPGEEGDLRSDVFELAREFINRELLLANEHLCRKADIYLGTCDGSPFGGIQE